MKSLFHRVLTHAKLAGNFRLRWPIWFIREQCVQTLQQWWVKRPFRFLAQSREHPVEYCERPSPIIKQIGAQHVTTTDVADIVGFNPVERKQRSTAATFERCGVSTFVRHEM